MGIANSILAAIFCVFGAVVAYKEWGSLLALAGFVRYWYVYEITGALFLPFFLEWLEGFRRRRNRSLSAGERTIWTALGYGVLFLVLAFAFDLPKDAVLVSAAFTVPAHLRKVFQGATSDDPGIVAQFSLTFGCLIIAFFIAAPLTGWLDVADKAVERTLFAMLLGGAHFTSKALFSRAVISDEGKGNP